jgi:Phosphoribosylanthranilate isomerase
MRKLLIKVCGMRDAKNVRDVENLDVDFLGFIFYSGSSRYVGDDSGSLEVIRKCVKSKVGVFVNEPFDYISDKAELCKLDYLQLHGNETPDLCRELQRLGYSVIKAFSIASADDFKSTENYSGCCDYFLFDTKCVGYGGSGQRFDWLLLNEYHGAKPFLLSGGLTPDSFGDLNRLEHPMFAGIDLNSGFEVSPAMKDIDKLRIFIDQIRKQ